MPDEVCHSSVYYFHTLFHRHTSLHIIAVFLDSGTIQSLVSYHFLHGKC